MQCRASTRLNFFHSAFTPKRTRARIILMIEHFIPRSRRTVSRGAGTALRRASIHLPRLRCRGSVAVLSRPFGTLMQRVTELWVGLPGTAGFLVQSTTCGGT